MKKSLQCKDLGVPSCSFKVKSKNEDELLHAMMAHAAQYHPKNIATLSKKQESELLAQMKKAIK